MKLLLDENLSFRLLSAIADRFPGSMHVRDIGLANVEDGQIWQFAGDNGFAVRRRWGAPIAMSVSLRRELGTQNGLRSCRSA
ncbi:MAG: hypothetical protein EXQ87_08665 [Alphaproteobacteria bacterium]|nr:hypothetical protein [Alphaproteobacteria bacterium]